jgi:hypothetical protein
MLKRKLDNTFYFIFNFRNCFSINSKEKEVNPIVKINEIGYINKKWKLKILYRCVVIKIAII